MLRLSKHSEPFFSNLLEEMALVNALCRLVEYAEGYVSV
jgi:hypothetical protein